jgi:uncharacterized coiled-coil protein SlyX
MAERRPPYMKKREPKIKELVRLIGSLEEELSVLESSHSLQFDTTASLRDKLVAAKRARSALVKSRRLYERLKDCLLNLDE